MNLEHAIEIEKKLHPLGTLQDIYKLIYQSCLGNGHMISSSEDSYKRLCEEKKIATPDPIQEIGNGYVRMPLSLMREEDLLLWNEIFMESNKAHGTHRAFDQALQTYGFKDQGAVHHSETYKDAYNPHYRVLKKIYVDYFEVIVHVLKHVKTTRVFAIDGPCASGKTTLGNLLSSLLECPCIHMDDYFLRPEQRSKERYAQPGGNIDYERFIQEVIDPLNEGKDLHLKAYNCTTQTMMPEKVIEDPELVIIEGSYSHHPKFEALKMHKIFLDLDKTIQTQRLKERSASRYKDFIEKWIPMENKYFQTFHIKEKSDYVF